MADNIIDRQDLYQSSKPEHNDRTRKRLTEIVQCGMKIVGVAEFGVKGVMSGLYIEKVWNASDQEFDDYMSWARSLIAEKQTS